jgi:hypothetical protein
MFLKHLYGERGWHIEGAGLWTEVSHDLQIHLQVCDYVAIDVVADTSPIDSFTIIVATFE